jgi:hypothetical protein
MSAMRNYAVEILRGEAFLEGGIFPGRDPDYMLAPAGQVINVREEETENLLAQITFEMESVFIIAGPKLDTRVEEFVERYGQKIRYSDSALELIIQVAEL